MRLINTDTLKLEEFWDDQIPPYAILSHTWGKEEVTFQDFQDLHVAKHKAGYAKIVDASLQARRDSLDYLWVDTNCIDKTSSSELTEAINSMFEWYKRSEKCYAYLEDVTFDRRAITDGTKRVSWATREDAWNDPQDPDFVRFRASRWFTRGWTLQELLAPQEVHIYSRDWELLGTRTILAGYISSATNIDEQYLTRAASLDSASVACKMSWLSSRKTSRREDIAYCMLGLFGINMSLLYGEGNRAFIRLQEELLKSSTDHTIFCWTWTDSVPTSWTSLLAPSPDTFANGNEIEQNVIAAKPSPYSMTNFGLKITLPIIQTWSYCFLMLNARRVGDNGTNHPLAYKLCIPIKARRNEQEIFQRVSFPTAPVSFTKSRPRVERSIFVRAKIDTVQIGANIDYRAVANGILLSVQDPVSFLSRSSSSYEYWAAAAGNRILDEISRAIRVETYPARAFDTKTSIFWIDASKPGTSSGMMRIGRQGKWNCLLYFAVLPEARRKHGGRWVVRSLPPDVWKDDSKSRSRILYSLDDEYQETDGTVHLAENVALGVELGRVIYSGQGSVIRSAHLIDHIDDHKAVAPPQEGKNDWEDELSDSSIVARIEGQRSDPRW